MIAFEKAFEMVMSRARVLGSEDVALVDALNRVLAADVASDMDMPPFDRAMMDGYACRREDLAQELTVLETIQAGCAATKAVGKNECAKIMTGAPVPEGADCVIMIEETETPRPNIVRFTGKDTAGNISPKGEDVRAGDFVVRQGDRIGPAQVAMLASVGCCCVCVARRPRVGVIATGDELVEPHVKPKASQIRTSNSLLLCAQVATVGAASQYYGIARDTDAALDSVVKQAMGGNDVLLVSGGVSKGDFDLVPGVLKKNGFEILFDSVAVKPGKPTTFAVSPSAYCFGLPGNPVSTLVQFELLVKPFLFRLMGHAYRPLTCSRPLAKPIVRADAGRAAWVPVSLTDEGEVRALEYHGSAHIAALCRADGLLALPIGVSSIAKGTRVSVRPIWPHG